ncbi:MAG: TRC40/GET3/ArsA family transport-energizing ATPase [Psychrilyobacter sp.]|uniref:ArsA family ATPase n=1 Tax=Psychrilyobacter sp. TaxID=2586924 RepID=UPI003C76154A
MNKIIFVGGKGGVGKTTCASSLAWKYSKKYKVLLVSTDPAHSTRDLFGIPPKKNEDFYTFSENLDILEIDGEKESNIYISRIKNQCCEMLSPVILCEVEKQLDNAGISPGAYESAIFEKISQLILKSTEYDYIVFDTAPTGHTLRLITFPTAMNTWMESLIKKRKKILMLKNMKFNKKNKFSDDSVLNILESRHNWISDISKVLMDPSRVSFNFVMNAEKLSFLETKRAVKTLDEYGINIDKIIINRLLPDSSDPFWQGRKDKEDLFLDLIFQDFKGKKLIPIPYFLEENNNILETIGSLIK